MASGGVGCRAESFTLCGLGLETKDVRLNHENRVLATPTQIRTTTITFATVNT